MWLWLLMLLLLPSLLAPLSSASSSSTGPTSESEAAVLWTEGKAAIDQARYQDAANSFQRLVDRYPGNNRYLISLFYLGKSLLETNRTEKSVQPLKDFISASPLNENAIEARILLGQAHLKLQRPSEAYLITQETETSVTKKFKQWPGNLLLENLLLRSEALLQLHQNQKASLALDSAKRELSKETPKKLSDRTYDLLVEAKIRDCGRLKFSHPISEIQALGLMDRRGTCLLESALLYRQGLATGKTPMTEKSADRIKSALESYKQACAHPPLSPELKKSKSSEAKYESKRYQQELAERLIKECKQKVNEATQSLDPSTP